MTAAVPAAPEPRAAEATSPESAAAPESTKIPRDAYVFAASLFMLVAATNILTPLIPQVRLDFGVSISTAGLIVGSYGLAKLSDFYKRLHGPTKATTLGVGGVLLASCLFFISAGRGGTEQILVALFLFITAPVSAHLLVKAVLSLTADRPPQPPPPQPPDDGRGRP